MVIPFGQQMTMYSMHQETTPTFTMAFRLGLQTDPPTHLAFRKLRISQSDRLKDIILFMQITGNVVVANKK
jgi:hypothetical protein